MHGQQNIKIPKKVEVESVKNLQKNLLRAVRGC